MAKTKYTPDTVDRIIAAVRRGMSDLDACIIADICQDTFYTWLKERAEFSEAISRARADWKDSLVKKVEAHGEKDWRALAFLLERKCPQEFGAIQRLQHSGDGGGPLKFVVELEEPVEDDEPGEAE